MAEHLWQDAHKLLIDYVSEATQTSRDEIELMFYSDSNFKHQLIQKNGHVMTAYFTNRDKKINNTVLKETIQFLDAWFRNEFAKMCGAIHSHGIYYSP